VEPFFLYYRYVVKCENIPRNDKNKFRTMVPSSERRGAGNVGKCTDHLNCIYNLVLKMNSGYVHYVCSLHAWNFSWFFSLKSNQKLIGRRWIKLIWGTMSVTSCCMLGTLYTLFHLILTSTLHGKWLSLIF
jgi:hypothetical protein